MSVVRLFLVHATRTRFMIFPSSSWTCSFFRFIKGWGVFDSLDLDRHWFLVKAAILAAIKSRSRSLGGLDKRTSVGGVDNCSLEGDINSDLTNVGLRERRAFGSWAKNQLIYEYQVLPMIQLYSMEIQCLFLL